MEKKVALVAIDGPSGSGKSALARSLALRLGILHIDTGAMYRALSLAAKARGIPFQEGRALAHFLEGLDFKYAQGNGLVSVAGEDLTQAIREHHVSDLASLFSALPSVRRYLGDFQRRLPGKRPCVMEGRDIGTVIFPGAFCKFFVTASVEVRAKRRYEQLKEKGQEDISLEGILEEQRMRDERDKARIDSPLRQAPDAEVIDTSDQTLEEATDFLAEKVKNRAQRVGLSL